MFCDVVCAIAHLCCQSTVPASRATALRSGRLKGLLGADLMYLCDSVDLLAVGDVQAAATGALESVVLSAIAAVEAE